MQRFKKNNRLQTLYEKVKSDHFGKKTHLPSTVASVSAGSPLGPVVYIKMSRIYLFLTHWVISKFALSSM